MHFVFLNSTVYHLPLNFIFLVVCMLFFQNVYMLQYTEWILRMSIGQLHLKHCQILSEMAGIVLTSTNKTNKKWSIYAAITSNNTVTLIQYCEHKKIKLHDHKIRQL